MKFHKEVHMADVITPDDLYAIYQEAHISIPKMRALCAALGTEFPPKSRDFTPLTGKTELQSQIESYEGVPA